MSNSLWPHGLQHARLPCPSLSPRLAQTHVHWVSDAIQPSHPLLAPSPVAGGWNYLLRAGDLSLCSACPQDGDDSCFSSKVHVAPGSWAVRQVYVTSSGQGALTRIMRLFQVQSLKSWCVSLWMHHPLPWWSKRPLVEMDDQTSASQCWATSTLGDAINIIGDICWFHGVDTPSKASFTLLTSCLWVRRLEEMLTAGSVSWWQLAPWGAGPESPQWTGWTVGLTSNGRYYISERQCFVLSCCVLCVIEGKNPVDWAASQCWAPAWRFSMSLELVDQGICTSQSLSWKFQCKTTNTS